MASNPMQRKARLSFFMGMFITLLITGAIIAFLVITIMNQKAATKKEEEAKKEVLILKQDIKSGQIITSDLYESKTVNSSIVPADALTKSNIGPLQLQDKQGRQIKVNIKQNGDNVDVETVLVLNNGQGEEQQVKIEPIEGTDNYCYYAGGQRVVVELEEIPLVAKVDMKKNAVLAQGLTNKGTNTLSDDTREQQYNMLTLPVEIETGDTVDVRLSLPDGQDFIVVSKKEVTIPEVAGAPSADTINLSLREQEILQMGCAIVDYYRTPGAKLYVTKYTDAGIQSSSTPTYVADSKTLDLIRRDPNIIEEIKNALVSDRQDVGANEIRKRIDSVADPEAGLENLKTKVEESITNSKEARQSYLDGMATK